MTTKPAGTSFPESGYRLLFEHTGVATMFVGEDATILVVNQWFEKLTGYSKLEAEGLMSLSALIADPADGARMRQYHAARRIDPDLAPIEYDSTIRTKSGGRRRVTVRVTMVPGTMSSLISLVDITDRLAAEEARRESEAQYRSLIEHMQDTVYRCDLDGTLTFVSPSGARVIGVEAAEELIGRNIARDFYADPSDRVALLEELRKHGKVTKYEVRLRRRDGRIVTIEVDSQFFYDTNGQVAGVEGIYSDVTRRKEAERRLRDNEERLRAITKNIPGVVFQFTVEPDGHYEVTYVSERLGLMLGLKPELREVFPSLVAHMHGDDREPFVRSIREAVEREAPWRFEGRLRDEAGGTFWFQAISQPTRIDGRLVFNGILLDVTQRKLAEEKSRQSAEMFTKVFMTAPDCIAITRLEDGTIVDVNEGFEAITGWQRDEAVGRTSAEIHFYADPSARDYLRTTLEAGRKIVGHEFQFRRKDGEERTGVYSARPIVLDGERCLIFVLQDVTEQNRLQEESRKLEEQLHQSRKMDAIGQLAGGVAHDFNNMLGVILGETELALLHTRPDDPMRGHLIEVRRAAQRSTDLTRQLLAFARRQTIAPRALDLNAVVAGTLKMLRRLIGEDVSLDFEPGAGLWPVMMDPSQIDQILANLCVNARDAITGVGTITIETGNTTLDDAECRSRLDCAPGDYVTISVKDTGSGMDRKTLESLFEPFFTTKAVGRGTGLGLATVHGIVTQNAGAIEVASEPGAGSLFRIYLPRYPGEPEKPAPEPAPGSGAEAGQETILLVEDEPGVLRMAGMMLGRLGYRVLAAESPSQALTLAEACGGQIHLLMTDVIMPEMNGRELADRLQARYPDLRQLFCSGYTADVIAHRGVLDGGVHFIQKPFTMDQLAAKLREALTADPARPPV